MVRMLTEVAHDHNCNSIFFWKPGSLPSLVIAMCPFGMQRESVHRDMSSTFTALIRYTLILGIVLPDWGSSW